MRFLFRLISLLALVAAVIAGTIDAIRSVAAGRTLLTSLKTAWADISPGTLEALRQAVRQDLSGQAIAAGLQFVLAQPAFAVLLVLSLVFYWAGYRRKRPAFGDHYATR
jgi:hypothetical protein